MSRSGYSDDCDNLGLWRGAVESAIRGRRGQALLQEMAAALDALPVKELIAGEVVRDNGHVCALGAVAVLRKMNVADLDIYDGESVGRVFDVARAFACEVAYENDECGERIENGRRVSETPAERWTRMRRWVAGQIGERTSGETGQ